MVRAWYMDDSEDDQRFQHQLNPPEYVDLNQLYDKSGVIYFQLDQDDETRILLEEIKKERGYTYEDQIEISTDKLPDYEEKLKIFYTEHLHTDEEIRFVSAGSGYFDVRDIHDRWIRIEVHAGDLLIIPAGIYHRFTLDTNNYMKARRFFVGEPKWTPHNRPAEHVEARQRYLDLLSLGFKISSAR